MIPGVLVAAAWQMTETASVPQEFLGKYQTEHDLAGKTYLTHRRIGSENLTHFLFKEFFLMAYSLSLPFPLSVKYRCLFYNLPQIFTARAVKNVFFKFNLGTYSFLYMNICKDSYQVVGLKKNQLSYKIFNGKAWVKNFLKNNFSPISFLWTRSQGWLWKPETTGCRRQKNVLMYVTLPGSYQLKTPQPSLSVGKIFNGIYT